METSARTRTNVLVVLLVVLSLCSVSQGGKAHVTIYNVLGKERGLMVHCWSGDDDLGAHFVVDGGEYGWAFKPNIIHTTRFACELGWQNVGHFLFDAFSYKRDWGNCGHNCAWRVAEEGVYQWDGMGAWVLKFKWP